MINRLLVSIYILITLAVLTPLSSPAMIIRQPVSDSAYSLSPDSFESECCAKVQE